VTGFFNAKALRVNS